MNEDSIPTDPLEFFDEQAALAPDASKKTISFSQYSLFLRCPFAWKLSYIDGLRKRADTIHTVFGTVIHEVIQHYINLLYTEGSLAADHYNMEEAFVEKFNAAYLVATERNNHDGSITADALVEFTADGLEILKWISRPSNRKQYFPSQAYLIEGVELPLNVDVGNNVKYIGFLDLVLRDKSTNEIKIIDFKTSRNNWNKYQKTDVGKTDQLLLYKKFYSEQFGVPLDDIEVEFVILKKKLLDGYGYSSNGRISTFAPLNGKLSIKKASERFQNFIQEGFTPTGEFNVNNKFPKNPGKAKKNCKYCDFYGTPHCDSKNEIKEISDE
jgi:RecB family exonuclease